LYGSTVEIYKQKAIEKRLYDTRYWHLLGHYNGEESEIENSEFFLSPDGKTSPKAELLATIDGLFSSVDDDNATQCRYPARTRWLKKELDLKTLPYVECKRYNELIQKLDPTSVTIVFPSAHINSPASMYGHTFLRINSSYNSKLLAYAINYAADADPAQTNAIVFSLKGLFGGYYGQYSLLPYTDKLKEYRDGENRDIWEYDLNFDKNETLQMVEHIWEIKDTKTTYYFFNKNCSYEVLWLLEVARPTLHLREYFHYQVIPFETIHVAKKEGIIAQSHYRASKRSLIEAYKKVLDIKEIALAKKLYKAEIAPKQLLENTILTKEKKGYILEASIELLQYYYQKHEISKELYLKRFHALTTARATLGRLASIKPTPPPNPLEGHRANRFRFGGGILDDDGAFFIGYRPAYHDLEDSSYGFLRGTQIEFFNIDAYLTKEKARVETATLISIKSIAPVDPFFTPVTWKLSIGWDRNSLEEKARFYGLLGAGSSVANSFGYGYVTTDIFAYDNDIANFGVGVSVGGVIDKYASFTNTTMEYSYRYYDNKEGQNLFHFAQNFRIAQNFSILLRYQYKQRYENDMKEKEEVYSLMLEYYY